MLVMKPKMTKEKLTAEEKVKLQIMNVAAKAVLKEDKKLFEELAKY